MLPKRKRSLHCDVVMYKPHLALQSLYLLQVTSVLIFKMIRIIICYWQKTSICIGSVNALQMHSHLNSALLLYISFCTSLFKEYTHTHTGPLQRALEGSQAGKRLHSHVHSATIGVHSEADPCVRVRALPRGSLTAPCGPLTR